MTPVGVMPCALGKSGRRSCKREGDGATPIGTFLIREVLYRRDRLMRPATGLAARALRQDDGWCDAVGDRNYNRHVRHPYPHSAERLMREDEVYDVVVVLGVNERPRRQGCGSAIFMHLARPRFEPTAGCVALRRRDLLNVLKVLKPGSRITVTA